MKKTVSMIYRFVFILFAVWGICQKVGANIIAWTWEILDFPIFVDFLCFLCILCVFIIRITRKPGKLICGIKACLTLCAVVVLLTNSSMLRMGISYDWVMRILLPIMMIADWLIFDDRGRFRLYDPFLWLCGAFLTAAALGAILKNIFGLDNYLDLLGIFKNKKELADMLLKALVIGLAMYLLDVLGGAFKKKGFKNIFALIYRLVFLALEIFAFLNAVGREITDLLTAFRYYEIITNFLCAVCIAVVLIYNVVKFGSLKTGTSPFPRLKTAFTVCILVNTVAHIAYNTNFSALSISYIIFYLIAPIMMAIDWIVFDYKGSIEIYDPFLWCLMPFAYYIVAVCWISPRYGGLYPRLFSAPQPEMIICSLGAVVIMGYIFYITDKIAAHN